MIPINPIPPPSAMRTEAENLCLNNKRTPPAMTRIPPSEIITVKIGMATNRMVLTTSGTIFWLSERERRVRRKLEVRYPLFISKIPPANARIVADILYALFKKYLCGS